MTAYSAFQSNAFQSNSFQIASSGATATIIGGHFLPAHHRNKRILSNVNVIYKQAQALPRAETKALRDAISEFVPPEVARIAEVPDISRLNYDAMAANSAAYERFIDVLASIESRLKEQQSLRENMRLKAQQEDDDLLLVSIISLLII